MKVRLRFYPNNVWVGVYWRVEYQAEGDDSLYAFDLPALRRKLADAGGQYRDVVRELHVYVCLVPCLPLHFVWRRPLGVPS